MKKFEKKIKKNFTNSNKGYIFAPRNEKSPNEGFFYKNGGMAEWFNAAVLKTAVRESAPGVRIPVPPPCNLEIVAQLVRAPDCGSGGRGFKPHHSP
ncbi:MAG: hypothetical protein RIS64_94 [Bacteroidota bacterium]|jgi:hypothetical protein